MSVHADLHRHLGGSVVPRIFWRYLHRSENVLSQQYPIYEEFEDYVTRPRATLT